MKPNMGTLDRAIRTLIALVIAALCFTHRLGGTAAVVLGIFAVVFLVTSLFARCPLYVLLHLSTRKSRGGPATPPR